MTNSFPSLILKDEDLEGCLESRTPMDMPPMEIAPCEIHLFSSGSLQRKALYKDHKNLRSHAK